MNVLAVIKAMRAKGLSEGDILDVVEAGLSGERARSAGAERQARYRERKAEERETSVTSDVTSDVTGVSVSRDKERSPTPPKENSTLPTSPNLSVHRKRSTPSEFFDRFWNAYPRREGANPKQPALKAFNRAVSGGADPEAIISGARKYADGQAGKDARFVAQAVTWLNQRRWEDEVSATATGPPIAEVPRFETHEEHLAWWRERQARA